MLLITTVFIHIHWIPQKDMCFIISRALPIWLNIAFSDSWTISSWQQGYSEYCEQDRWPSRNLHQMMADIICHQYASNIILQQMISNMKIGIWIHKYNYQSMTTKHAKYICKYKFICHIFSVLAFEPFAQNTSQDMFNCSRPIKVIALTQNSSN